jgi:hypothetical protein
MAGWFSWFGGKAPGSRLKRLLKRYPPYRIPHRGYGWDLTLAQAKENLAYLLANRQQRLEIVNRFLSEFGLDLTAALAADDPKPFLDALWRWSLAEWPFVHDPAFTTTAAWLNSTREGPQIVFSMLMDIAIAVAEMVLVRRPGYTWALDLALDHQADDRVSWQRPVLLRPARRKVPAILFDVEDVVHGQYSICKSTPDDVPNHLEMMVLDAVSGAQKTVFRQQAGDGRI